VTTDTSERGLERLICTALTGGACDPSAPTSALAERPAPHGGAGYICGSPADYDRDHAVDLAQLAVFANVVESTHEATAHAPRCSRR